MCLDVNFFCDLQMTGTCYPVTLLKQLSCFSIESRIYINFILERSSEAPVSGSSSVAIGVTARCIMGRFPAKFSGNICPLNLAGKFLSKFSGGISPLNLKEKVPC